jgi:hypothetical protein
MCYCVYSSNYGLDRSCRTCDLATGVSILDGSQRCTSAHSRDQRDVTSQLVLFGPRRTSRDDIPMPTGRDIGPSATHEPVSHSAIMLIKPQTPGHRYQGRSRSPTPALNPQKGRQRGAARGRIIGWFPWTTGGTGRGLLRACARPIPPREGGGGESVREVRRANGNQRARHQSLPSVILRESRRQIPRSRLPPVGRS